jgi:hypothetical protein
MLGDEGHTFFVTTAGVEFARVFECGSQYYDILVSSLSYVFQWGVGRPVFTNNIAVGEQLLTPARKYRSRHGQ